MSAAQAIGEYLQSPDDLVKVAAFRKKLEKEKASIDARLKSGVKEQLDATREGLKKLLSTRNNVQAIKEEMQTVDRLCTDPQHEVATFDQISRVSMVHRNFEQTEDMVNNLLEMNSKLDVLEEVLAADSENLIGPRSERKQASAASRQKLIRIFERLSKLIEDFEFYVLELARNILPLVRAELEGREDEKAIAIRLVKKAAKMDCSDLIRIESDVVPCFPPSYEIYSFYIKEYHKNLDMALKQASILLHLHAWLKEYKKSMKELNVPPELIEPPLLNGEEQNLIEDYLKLIVKKLDEWSANLMKTEIQEFTTRTNPPEVDSDGLYGMQGAVILFQMARVVEEVNRVMRSIQDRWSKVVDSEFKKQVEKPEEVTGGLAEYCLALANDQVKSADNTEALLGRLEPLVSEKYRVPINDKLNDAIDGNLDVAKKCIQTFIDIIFNDVKPATKQLFQPSCRLSNPALFELLVDYLIDAFLVTYLTALGNCSKLRMPDATERIKEDISAVFAFFGDYKPDKELEGCFEVVEMILAMLEASKSMAFLSYWAFAKVHGPCIPFVEGLMKARGDLDRSGVSEVMDSIKRKAKDEGLTDPPQPTIMKKITVQSALSRFLRSQ
ncbi:exocyst complex component Sec6-domain-containing protein [Pisolithus croceorrhizus]|nr:exocyst complex component Sec6-domain-containing protein [Pisolithus croceorrhizus]